jgi:hypothetical protein
MSPSPEREGAVRCGGSGEVSNPGASAFDSRCPCPGCPDCKPRSEEGSEYGEHLQEVCERHRDLPLEEQRAQGRSNEQAQSERLCCCGHNARSHSDDGCSYCGCGEFEEQVEDCWPVVTLYRSPRKKGVFAIPSKLLGEESGTYYPADHPAVLSPDEARYCAQNLAVAAPRYHHEVRPEIEALARRLSTWAEGEETKP